MKIHGKEYTEVKDRIKEFRVLNPDWSIETELMSPVEFVPKWCLFRATLRAPWVLVGEHVEEKQMFTGWAYEERTEDSKEVNTTSWIENCETSAIGRALANMDLTLGESRPSAEEMQKVERMGGGGSVAVNPEPPSSYLRKTLGKPGKVGGVKPSTLTMLYKRSNDLRDLVGHDKYIMQALANRKVEEIAKIETETTAQNLLDTMSDLLDFVSSKITEAVGKVVPLRDVPEESRAKIIEALDKMSLLL